MKIAADQRPECRGDRGGSGDQPVGAGTLGLCEVRRHQRHDRRHDQHRPQPLKERPAEHQHRQAMRQGGGQRAAGVDDASDRERAFAPDHLTDLPAGDHQRRHHERVERDRGLDPGHRRSDILGDRRDRRVHDRRVQRHHKLPGRERDQGDLRSANALRRGARPQRRFNMRVGAHLGTRPLSSDERSSSSICRSISIFPPGFRRSVSAAC